LWWFSLFISMYSLYKGVSSWYFLQYMKYTSIEFTTSVTLSYPPFPLCKNMLMGFIILFSFMCMKHLNIHAPTFSFHLCSSCWILFPNSTHVLYIFQIFFFWDLNSTYE
jgi:hypothetical protein